MGHRSAAKRRSMDPGSVACAVAAANILVSQTSHFRSKTKSSVVTAVVVERQSPDVGSRLGSYSAAQSEEPVDVDCSAAVRDGPAVDDADGFALDGTWQRGPKILRAVAAGVTSCGVRPYYLRMAAVAIPGTTTSREFERQTGRHRREKERGSWWQGFQGGRCR